MSSEAPGSWPGTAPGTPTAGAKSAAAAVDSKSVPYRLTRRTPEYTMKKTLTVLIAAGALLGAAGCAASPQLTNEETCARVKTVVSAQSATSDKTGMNRVANQLRPITANASEALQAP